MCVCLCVYVNRYQAFNLRTQYAFANNIIYHFVQFPLIELITKMYIKFDERNLIVMHSHMYNFYSSLTHSMNRNFVCERYSVYIYSDMIEN